jgi:hypothetical protein
MNRCGGISAIEHGCHNLQFALEVLEQRTEQLRQECDTVYDQFKVSMQEVRQTTEFPALVLEQNVRASITGDTAPGSHEI